MSIQQLKASLRLLPLKPSDAPVGSEICRFIECVYENKVSDDELEAFLRVLSQDSALHIWTLKYLAAEETKVPRRDKILERLRDLIDTHHYRITDYLERLKLLIQANPTDAVLVGISLTQLWKQEQGLMLSSVIAIPSAYVLGSLRNHLSERLPYRMQLREQLSWMIGLPVLSASQRTRATQLLSECNAYADGSDHTAVTAPTSTRPARRHHGSSEQGASPRSREDCIQAPKRSDKPRTSSPPPYPRGDLIDLVASKKASKNQTRQFHSQAVQQEAFYQQAQERLQLYTAGSEENKQRKLRAVLEGVKSDRQGPAAAASSRQTRPAGEADNQSQGGSPAPKEPAPSRRVVPNLTREEKLAQRYHQDLDQLNRHIEELERHGEIKGMGDVSAELKIGIRTMHLQGVQQLATAKRAVIGAGGAGAGRRGTAEAMEAMKRFFAASFRFLELCMLATESGSRARAKADEVRARMARVVSSVATETVD